MKIQEVQKTPWQQLPADLRDAATRAADAVNLHLIGQGYEAVRDKYIAISLQDGSTDGVLYDTYADAVRHQMHYSQCYYLSFRNLPGGAQPRDLAILLQFARDAYDAGARFTDPDDVNGGRQLVTPSSIIDTYKRRMGLY